MTNRMLKIVAVVGLVAFVFTTWHFAQAKEWRIKKSDLPKGVLERIKKDFAKATIVKAEAEDDEEYRIRVYEVKFREGSKEREVMFSRDGTIVEAETVIAKDDLPKAVAKALAKAAKGGKIQKIEKTELLAVVKLVKLKTPEISYEAKFVKDGRRIEIVFAPNGKILEREEQGTEKKAKKPKKDDDEETVTLGQVPAAVKATILKEAGSNKILKIEKESEDGQMVYEAEWKSKGKEIEIKVAPNGKLLKKEVEDEDEDDDDDDDDD